MGWLKDAWNDDRPCFRIRYWNTDDDKPKVSPDMLRQLKNENQELKKLLKMKKAGAIEVEDYKLLE